MITSLDDHEFSVDLISIVTEFRVLNGFGIIYRDVFSIFPKFGGLYLTFSLSKTKAMS